MGRLTTHVLDTASGIPARNMKVELRRLDAAPQAPPLAHFETSADGRSPAPLLEGDSLRAGEYSLTFHVADYFLLQRDDAYSPARVRLRVITLKFLSKSSHSRPRLFERCFGF